MTGRAGRTLRDAEQSQGEGRQTAQGMTSALPSQIILSDLNASLVPGPFENCEQEMLIWPQQEHTDGNIRVLVLPFIPEELRAEGEWPYLVLNSF